MWKSAFICPTVDTEEITDTQIIRISIEDLSDLFVVFKAVRLTL